MSVVDTGSKRPQFALLASIGVLVALAWAYLWLEAERMAAMSVHGSAMAAMVQGGAGQPWSARSLSLTFVMWAIMMAAMMLPSALPAIVLHGAMAKQSRASGSGLPSTWFFTSGYLLVWALFSLGATAMQAALQTARLLTPDLASASAWLSGMLLMSAGLYQWLPVKNVCLRKCRTPLQLFLFRWRPGAAGAVRMGAEHGVACVGCCWALMLLLFAVGVMNLLWIALIAGLVLIEKCTPAGPLLGRLAGVALLLAGGAMIVARV